MNTTVSFAAGDVVSIKAALATALSETFAASLADLTNPYGQGAAGILIRRVLEAVHTPKTLLVKKFTLMHRP